MSAPTTYFNGISNKSKNETQLWKSSRLIWGMEGPKLDKLSVTLDYPHRCQGNVEKVRAGVKDVETFSPAPGERGRYHYAVRVRIPDQETPKNYPLLAFSYATDHQISLRLELNPDKLGPAGIASLREVMNDLVPNCWHYMRTIGKLTRVDIAVDFPHLLIESFFFLQDKVKRHWAFENEGPISEISMGVSKGNQTVIYQTGFKQNLGQAKSAQCERGIRVERRLRKNLGTPVELVDLSDPFIGFHMPMTVICRPAFVDVPSWGLFVDAAKAVTAKRAMRHFPKSIRHKLARHLRSASRRRWHPSNAWPKWQSYLTDLRLINAHL